MPVLALHASMQQARRHFIVLVVVANKALIGSIDMIKGRTPDGLIAVLYFRIDMFAKWTKSESD
jgi:hypothetical protein